MATVPSSHASSPAVVKVNSSASTITTASFDPPARSCLVVGFTSDADTTAAAPTISFGGGNAVTAVAPIPARGVSGQDVGLAALWAVTFDDPDADPAAMTVTVTRSIGGATKPMMLLVRVYTEDQVDIADPVGAVASASFASGTALTSGNMTPETTGGGLRMMWLDWFATGVPSTFQANTELVEAYHNAGLSTNVQIGKQTPTVAGVAETIGATLPAASTDGNWIAYELRAGAPLEPGPAFDATAFDATAFEVPGGGPATYPRDVAETLTVADSTSRTSSRTRSTTEALAAGDTAARTTSRSRTTAEGATTTDVTAGVVVRLITRSTGETLTVADATSRTSSRTRSTTEALAAGDTAARTTSRSRTTAEGATAADATSRTTSRTRSTTDAVAAADATAASTTGQIPRSTSEALQVADTSSRRTTAPRAPSEALTAADVPLRRTTRPRSTVDAVTTVDVTSRTAPPRARSTSDALATTDTSAASTTGQQARTISEGLVAADATSRRTTTPRPRAEALVLVDAAARRTTAPRVVLEALTTTDAAARAQSAARSLLEALTTTDASSATLGLPEIDVIVLAPPIGRQRQVVVGVDPGRDVDLGSRPPDPSSAGRRRTVTITGRPHEERR